jgi:hypothetical protein
VLRAVGSYKVTTTTTTVASQFHQLEGKLPTSHTQDVRRLVGYYEYTRSLSMLEPLAARASAAELKVIDDILASRPELTVHVNLSRRIPKSAPSSLDEPTADGGGGGGGNYARSGLTWLMALARIELGAMVAGFTDRPEPFATLPPTRREIAAYAELLLDGARTHYFGLANDPAAQFYASYRNRPFTLTERERGRPEVNEAHAIAYSRRVALAKEFAQAVLSAGKGRLSSTQSAEVTRWVKDMDELQDVIAYKVLGLGTWSGGGQSTITTTHVATQKASSRGQVLVPCPWLRDQARRDLARGKATIRDVTPGAQTGGLSNATKQPPAAKK